jgi:hypothetical protein
MLYPYELYSVLIHGETELTSLSGPYLPSHDTYATRDTRDACKSRRSLWNALSLNPWARR